MSNYNRVTKHPETGQFEPADWLDCYFGPRRYGVKFADGQVFEELKQQWEFPEEASQQKVVTNKETMSD